MNPIEEFYKKKRTYEDVNRLVGEFTNIYETDVKGNLNDGWQIETKLRTLFGDMGNDEKWEIYQIISVYIQSHQDKINEHLVKELKKRMEKNRSKVLKDFRLRDIKEVK